MNVAKAKIKILKRLSGGKRTTKGDWNEEIIQDLQRQALLQVTGDDNFEITMEGRSYLKRAMNADADPYRQQHQITKKSHFEDDQKIEINLAESPLSRLYYRRGRDGQRLIDDAQFLAGERLRKDFEFAQLSPKLGLSLTPRVDSGGYHAAGVDMIDRVIAARKRVDDALNFIGREMGMLLLDVCCFLKGLEKVEKERQWPARSAKVVLAVALNRLADHYGLGQEAHGPRPSRGKKTIMVWHAED